MKVKELIARLTALNIPEAEVCTLDDYGELRVCDQLEDGDDSDDPNRPIVIVPVELPR